MATAIAHTVTAAPLAALLPDRRRVPWTVGPAPQLIRAGAAMSRLRQGDRAFDIVELPGRIEVYADRPGNDLAPLAPDAVLTDLGPDPVAELAAVVLRTVLPRLEGEAMQATMRAHGWEQVVIDGAQLMNEVGFDLIDHGAHVEPTNRADGSFGIEWTAPSRAGWGLWVPRAGGILSLSYEGPVSGLYGVLPVLLPPADIRVPHNPGSVFTRHLTDRFPQLRAIADDQVAFGSLDDVNGFIALPEDDEPTDHADDSRQVVAILDGIGVDLLLTVVPHLV
ncbi:hypothetical protein ABZ023_18505 [Streptomyces sp. NPDC006367]|uniref:hypothetical protein n=1 Tax=unclassified Streptomyces TaxID=2593676 RepID=UPI0033BD4945